ncbi:MAG TPA: hypothetical protein VNM22_04160 [Candidatus Limnocylindrales bacterium]|nr:hypothetical protein [Candidatus Limnocylindrales bacterium]
MKKAKTDRYPQKIKFEFVQCFNFVKSRGYIPAYLFKNPLYFEFSYHFYVEVRGIFFLTPLGAGIRVRYLRGTSLPDLPPLYRGRNFEAKFPLPPPLTLPVDGEGERGREVP